MKDEVIECDSLLGRALQLAEESEAFARRLKARNKPYSGELIEGEVIKPTQPQATTCPTCFSNDARLEETGNVYCCYCESGLYDLESND
jgi:hypothetical protein